MRINSEIYDVIVVGAGPVGLLLAHELRLGGVSVLVLEALAERTSALKAAPLGVRGLSIATVETFYRRNMLGQLRALAVADAPPTAPSGQKEKRGGHFAGLAIDFDKVDQSRWIYRLPGPAASAMGASMEHIEHVLEKNAKALGATIVYGKDVTELTQTPEGVRITAGGDVYETRWVVGCDGGRSRIRKLAGFELVGSEAEFTAYAGLVTLADPQKLLAGRNLTPSGFYMQPLPGYVSVMEFDGGAFDRSRGISREHFQDVLRRVSGTDVTVTELRVATSYTDRAKSTTTLRKGQVLLAGDAAHIHSPLGGQGLNVGLGDALNLGWKLAATIRRRASEHLLRSYLDERHPISEWILEWTRAQVQLMKPDPHSRALRRLTEELLRTQDGATYFADKLWGVTLRYDLGSDRSLVGMSVPDFELTDGSRIGNHFESGKGILLGLDADHDFSDLARRYAGGLKVMTSGAKNHLGIRAVLVRPDGVVCWLADQLGESGPLVDAVRRWFDE